MKISTKTRYGIRLMIELGLHYNAGSIFLKDIASAEEISEKYLSQIIIPLKAAGMVNSFRGAHGGYVLAKAPKQITAKEILEVLDGNIDLIGKAKTNNQNNGKISIAVTRELWDDLEQSIAKTLNAVTLQHMVDSFKQKQGKNANMYNI